MTLEPQLEEEVEGLGNIYEITASFDKGLLALQKIGVEEPITLRDLAYAIVKKGYMSTLYREGSQVREGAIYLHEGFCPEYTVLLVRRSSCLDLAEGHREDGEFYLDDVTNYQEQAEEDKTKPPQDRRVLILNEKDKFIYIPTDKFDEIELTLWAFRDMARDYGLFLRNDNIEEMSITFLDKNYVETRKHPVLRQMRYVGLDWGLECISQFDLGASSEPDWLSCEDRIRGLCKGQGKIQRESQEDIQRENQGEIQKENPRRNIQQQRDLERDLSYDPRYDGLIHDPRVRFVRYKISKLRRR